MLFAPCLLLQTRFHININSIQKGGGWGGAEDDHADFNPALKSFFKNLNIYKNFQTSSLILTVILPLKILTSTPCIGNNVTFILFSCLGYKIIYKEY